MECSSTLVRKRLANLLLALTSLCGTAALAFAQSATASLGGTVLDESGGVLRGVSVTIVNINTGARRAATTDGRGFFTIPVLQPGRYTLTGRIAGFTPVEVKDLGLNVGDEVLVRLQLKVAPVGESITITAEPALVRTSPAVATVIDRQFVANLPLNGRSFHSLIELTPGVVLNRATFSDQGQFNVNGQRADANYLMVDGVGANIGINAGGGPQQAATGLLPDFAATGGMNNLASVEAMQEFQIKTSSYAAEFGRMPGAHISIVTRGGSNKLNGSLFEYFRHDSMDANDWFANQAGLPKPQLRQHDFGGVLGGPIVRDRLFFFFSYEGLRLRQPQVSLTSVPSLSLRAAAPAAVRPVLDAFPLPNGRDLGNGFAQFNAAYSSPVNLDATSLRLDYSFGSGSKVFARYNRATSDATVRGLFSATNILRPNTYQTDTFTAGVTTLHGQRIVNDLRVNLSRNFGDTKFVPDDLGGAVPLPESVFPFGSSRDAFFTVSFIDDASAAYRQGLNGFGTQRQFNLVDTATLTAGRHQLRLGFDYRYLFPTIGSRLGDIQYQFQAGGVLTNRANIILINRSGIFDYEFSNFSVFAQDTWRVNPRLTLDYGLRWEVNPPPSGRGGSEWRTVNDTANPTGLAPAGTPLWRTTYDNFAPRIGVSYSLTGDARTVIRAGGGIFYDVGSGAVGNQLVGAPYVTSRLFVGSYPVSGPNASPPPLVLVPPFGFTFVMDRNVKLPYSYQWNLALERALGRTQVVTVSYVGARGRRLLFTEFVRTPSFTSLNRSINAATSNYDALQVQYRRPLSHGLQALASYTLSRSRDIASDDSNVNIPVTRLDLELNEGYSNFDVRHVFTAAATYDLPLRKGRSVLAAIGRDWSIDLIGRARSGYPLTVVTGTDALGIGISSLARPNLVPGVPVWIDDSSVAGGRRLNRAAFQAAPAGQQGNLQRNSLRGFGAWQVDLALRREFPLPRGARLQARAEMFNIFNHPLFADPVTNLASGQFGRSTQMLGRSLGSGGQSGGLNPMYQIGGPRSVQLALKLLF